MPNSGYVVNCTYDTPEGDDDVDSAANDYY